MTIPITKEVIDYIARYGGRCRECADANGVCPSSGLPCSNPEEAICHVLEAYNYGIKHGFLKIKSE
jgi:hypothetical protein